MATEFTKNADNVAAGADIIEPALPYDVVAEHGLLGRKIKCQGAGVLTIVNQNGVTRELNVPDGWEEVFLFKAVTSFTGTRLHILV